MPREPRPVAQPEKTRTIARTTSDVAAVSVEGLSKSYGHIKALVDLDLQVSVGEVLALIGDNGAGKSTFVRCLSGIHPSDHGVIRVHGEITEIRKPADARGAGIETVHQHLALIEPLNVWQNMFLNRELTRRMWPLRYVGWTDGRAMARETSEVLDRLGVHEVLPNTAARRLSGGQRQVVAVARAAKWSRRIVVLDEPTASVGVEQTAAILTLVKTLASKGVAIILITHNMQHVLDAADRAVVLLRGRKVADLPLEGVTSPDLVDLITGARRTTVV